MQKYEYAIWQWFKKKDLRSMTWDEIEKSRAKGYWSHTFRNDEPLSEEGGLNEMGTKGWELVSVIQSDMDDQEWVVRRFYFKRLLS